MFLSSLFMEVTCLCIALSLIILLLIGWFIGNHLMVNN